MALPQPSQMLKKTGLKMTVEMLPSLINMVIPVGISRTVLNHGVQVIPSVLQVILLLICVLSV